MQRPSGYYAPLDELDWQVLKTCQSIDSNIGYMNDVLSTSSQTLIFNSLAHQYKVDPSIFSLCTRPIDIVSKLSNTYSSLPATDFSGRNSHTGPLIFFIHPAFLSAYLYYPLSRKINYPMIGIHPPSYDDLSLRSIPLLVEYYYNQIKSIRPHGPYHLGGWSFGGLMALALIERIKKDKENVASLSLIDPFFGIGERSFDFKQVFAEFVKKQPSHPHNCYLTNMNWIQNKHVKRHFLHTQMPVIHQHEFFDCDIPMIIIQSKDIKISHEESISKHYRQATIAQSPFEHFNMMDAKAIHYISPLINQHIKTYDC